MYTNQTTISRDEYVARARRQAAKAAIIQPGKRPEYYRRYEKVLRETTPGATPMRMERRVPDAQALFAALATADRSEKAIQSYPPARRQQLQQRITQLRAKAKANLRKLGYDVR